MDTRKDCEMSKTKLSVEKTTAYDRFLLHEFNRPINRHHVELLKKSIGKNGYMASHPIHVMRVKVNGKMMYKIMSGHHRYLAAKELGSELYFIVFNEEYELWDMEGTTRSWSANDYIDAYANAGYEEYVDLMSFAKKNNIPSIMAAALLNGYGANTGNITGPIKRGQFKIKTYQFANRVCKIVNECASLGIPFATHQRFVAAIANCCHVREFDDDTFLNRARLNPKMMKSRADRAGYLEEIEALYMYRTKKTFPLKFMAEQAAMKRNINPGANNGIKK